MFWEVLLERNLEEHVGATWGFCRCCLDMLQIQTLRKDKYNPAISKYHIEVDEDDEDVDEDVEREIKSSHKARHASSDHGLINL